MQKHKGFIIGLALGFSFALGCATAVTVIPPAHAQSGTVERWEYLEIQHGWDGGTWAQSAGAEGWELVQVGIGNFGNFQYFRRRL